MLLDGTNMAGEHRNGRLVADTPTVTARKRRRIGMVFQRFNLFAHLSALDNVAIGPRRVLGMKSADARALAAEQLARVRMSEHARKRRAQLSGGQQQRVAIARAMAMRPGADAVRRADLGAGSRTGRRGAGGDPHAWRRTA